MKLFLEYCSLLALILLFAFSCGSNKLTDEDKRSMELLLEENEKIHSFLMKTESGLPSLQGISAALDAFDKTENSEVSSQVSKMKLNLREIKGIDKEKDFNQFSLFSENLSKLTKLFSVDGVNKFYCPMENKYWLAKGRSIENPYSPEMRDCGSLVEHN
ncbi:MAG: hypothetical protein MH321_08825 [Leptospiraceae bacterium]|nr:hypothetical protein [Leptospiraceae bacterium]